jgi:hypothetical protein
MFDECLSIYLVLLFEEYVSLCYGILMVKKAIPITGLGGL